MAKIIEDAEVVEVLELRGNTLGVGAGQRLAHALELHPELKVILHYEVTLINSGKQFLAKTSLIHPVKDMLEDTNSMLYLCFVDFKCVNILKIGDPNAGFFLKNLSALLIFI